MRPAITLSNLTVSYERRPAVHHVSGSFMEGSVTAIAGPNGGGKSTLIKTLAGIIDTYEGSLTFDAARRSDMAYLPQAAGLQRDFPLSILQMVTCGFWRQGQGFSRITREQREAAAHAIERVGLADFRDRTLDTLSAGQFQRALFARLLVQDARLILLDEPFTSVDNNSTDRLLSLIEEMKHESRTIICVLHDYEQIRTHFPQCLMLARRVIGWGPTASVLTEENVHQARCFREAQHHKHEVCEA